MSREGIRDGAVQLEILAVPFSSDDVDRVFKGESDTVMQHTCAMRVSIDLRVLQHGAFSESVFEKINLRV